MQSHLFTERETEVLRLLQQGLSNKQIAMALGITERTVEFHLSNIFTKLGVNSRTEAVIRLADQAIQQPSVTSTGPAIRDSTVEKTVETVENGAKSIRFARVPLKKKMVLYIAGAILFLGVCLYTLLFSSTAPSLYKGTKLPQLPATQTEQPAESVAPTLSITQPASHMYTQIIGNSTISLELKWFYIDAQRMNLQFTVSGFPIPAGTKLSYLVENQKIRLLEGNGNPISIQEQPVSGGSGGVAEPNEQPEVFATALDAVLVNPNQAIDPASIYQIVIPVGGKVYDINSQPVDLPEISFKISTPTFHPDSLTYTTNKTAKIQDKTITFYRLEVNPVESNAFMCVTDPAGEQWLPAAVSILYKGNSYSLRGAALTSSDEPPKTGQYCYRMSIPVPVDLSEDPKPELALWVSALSKDRPEIYPPEMVEPVISQMAQQGIIFEYVIVSHGSEFRITQKPAGMTEDEALTLITKAFIQQAIANGVLIFNLN